jgi:hypothetical protein
MYQEIKIGQNWRGKWSEGIVEIYDVTVDDKGTHIYYAGENSVSYSMSKSDFIERFDLLEDIEEEKENNMEFVEVDEVRVGQVWGYLEDYSHEVEGACKIEQIKVVSNAKRFAVFESGVEILVGKLFNDTRYVCLEDTPKKEDINPKIVAGHYHEKQPTNEHNFSDILNSIGEMLAEKDKRYGNSALKPLDIFSKHHSYGARLDEKLARVKNSGEMRKNDVADIIGGLVLICRDNGWTDFSDQID